MISMHPKVAEELEEELLENICLFLKAITAH